MNDAPQPQPYPEWGVRLFAILVIVLAVVFVWFAYWVTRMQAQTPAVSRTDSERAGMPHREQLHIDASDPQLAASGKVIYDRQCGSCHGGNLEGQANWRSRSPNGRMPAPPHDENGHTWHHPDGILFGIVKYGIVPPYGPPGYQSDMPAFGGKLSDDEIRATLAFIESRWPPKIMQWRQENLQAQAKQ